MTYNVARLGLYSWVFTLAVGCGASLPETLMPSIGNTLEATKGAYMLVCSPVLLNVAEQLKQPDLAATCDVAAVNINTAIELYTDLNNELK